jgi:anti-anti-sigma factor
MLQHQSPSGNPAPALADPAKASAMNRFELTEIAIRDGCREIAVTGELDMAVADRLQQAIAGCEADQILVSLEECRFIDSTGIAVLLRAHRGEGPRLVAHSPSGQVLRILEVSGLTGNGFVFADREQALQALQVGTVAL